MVKYAVECNATYSQDPPLLFRSSGSARQHTLNLNSNDNGLRINELYNCLVRIEGLPNSESERMELSMLLIHDCMNIFHNFLIILKVHLMSNV